MGFLNQVFRPAARMALVSAALTAAVHIAAPHAQAQTAAPGTAPMETHATIGIAPNAIAQYNNRWEAFGGLLYMNGQAGQDLQYRYNMGGGEGMGTYWLGSKPVKTWGVSADYRFGAGTTPVNPVGNNPLFGFNRVLVMQHIMTGGVSYRTPFRNRYVAIDAHALAGGAYGIFDHAIRNYPNQAALTIAACPAQVDSTHPVSLGTYCNHVAPYGTAGISMDFNDTAKLAVRLQPMMVFEHFGTETREYVSVSLGIMYRFGIPKEPKK